MRLWIHKVREHQLTGDIVSRRIKVNPPSTDVKLSINSSDKTIRYFIDMSEQEALAVFNELHDWHTNYLLQTKSNRKTNN